MVSVSRSYVTRHFEVGTDFKNVFTLKNLILSPSLVLAQSNGELKKKTSQDTPVPSLCSCLDTPVPGHYSYLGTSVPGHYSNLSTPVSMYISYQVYPVITHTSYLMIRRQYIST